jgi:PBP1b-binding outer membrane lipoprotein LpoB
MRLSLVALLALVLSSCSSGEPPPAVSPDPGAGPQAVEEQARPATDAEPEAMVLAPLAFSIARYPGAEQLGDSPDFLAENKDQEVRWLQFETADAPGRVIAFYKAEADKAGFTVTEETEKKLAKSLQIKAERPQGGTLRVNTMVQEDGNTFINVHIGEDL